MAGDRIDPGELIPKADFLDQHTPLDAGSLTDPDPDPDPRTDLEPGPVIPEASGDAAGEADRIEQHTPVIGDDDDYPHHTDRTGWS